MPLAELGNRPPSFSPPSKPRKRFSEPIIHGHLVNYQNQAGAVLPVAAVEAEDEYDFQSSEANSNPFGIVCLNDPYYMQAPGLSPPSSVPHSLTPASSAEPLVTRLEDISEGLSCSETEEYEVSCQDTLPDGNESMEQEGNNIKKKRRRTSPDQLRVLLSTFIHCPMPSYQMRVELANKIGMTPRAVQVWFQNRRAKEKTDLKKSESSYPPQQYSLSQQIALPMHPYPMGTHASMPLPFSQNSSSGLPAYPLLPPLPPWNSGYLHKQVMFPPYFESNHGPLEGYHPHVPFIPMSFSTGTQMTDGSMFAPPASFTLQNYDTPIDTQGVFTTSDGSTVKDGLSVQNRQSSYVQMSDISPPFFSASRSNSLPY